MVDGHGQGDPRCAVQLRQPRGIPATFSPSARRAINAGGIRPSMPRSSNRQVGVVAHKPWKSSRSSQGDETPLGLQSRTEGKCGHVAFGTLVPRYNACVSIGFLYARWTRRTPAERKSERPLRVTPGADAPSRLTPSDRHRSSFRNALSQRERPREAGGQRRADSTG
jgi:hypothetical protein